MKHDTMKVTLCSKSAEWCSIVHRPAPVRGRGEETASFAFFLVWGLKEKLASRTTVPQEAAQREVVASNLGLVQLLL